MKKTILIITIIVLSAGILAGGYAGYMYFSGGFDYNKAVSLMEEGKYEEALKLFDNVKNYKDSEEKIKECQDKILSEKYNEALSLIDNKEYIKAHDILVSLGEYKDSKDKLSEIDRDYKDEVLKTAAVGDIVIFGEYEQDADFTNGKEDIEWIVLDKKDGKVLLLTKYAIYNMKYYPQYQKSTTWQRSEVRSWLNSTFYNSAFSSSELRKIKKTTLENKGNPYEQGKDTPTTEDYVFLLSLDDAETLFESNEARKTTATPYAEYFGAFSAKEGGCWWWLRTNGLDGRKAVNIARDGSIDTIGVGTNTEFISVRPAMWVTVE